MVYYLSSALALTITELAALLHITARTLQRKNESQPLPVPVSEHAIELARVVEKGKEVFRDTDRFQSWLKSPLISLGGVSPHAMLDTTFGIRMVHEELGRMQHGVYS